MCFRGSYICEFPFICYIIRDSLSLWPLLQYPPTTVSQLPSHHLLWSAEGALCLSTDLLYGRCVWSLVLSPHLAIIPNICSPHNLVPKQQLVKVETRTIASISQAELWADWESGGVITILQPLAMLFVGIYKRYINWQRPCDYFRPTPFMWTLVLLCRAGELICWAIHQKRFSMLMFVNWFKGAQVDNTNWIKLINMICNNEPQPVLLPRNGQSW